MDSWKSCKFESRYIRLQQIGFHPLPPSQVPWPVRSSKGTEKQGAKKQARAIRILSPHLSFHFPEAREKQENSIVSSTSSAPQELQKVRGHHGNSNVRCVECFVFLQHGGAGLQCLVGELQGVAARLSSVIGH